MKTLGCGGRLKIDVAPFLGREARRVAADPLLVNFGPLAALLQVTERAVHFSKEVHVALLDACRVGLLCELAAYYLELVRCIASKAVEDDIVGGDCFDASGVHSRNCRGISVKQLNLCRRGLGSYIFLGG